jgi:methionine-rich copper-binding protein CopC
LAIFLLLVAGCALGTAGPALADDTVQSTTPADGSTVPGPVTEVQINFAQLMSNEATKIVVTGADGTSFSTGPVTSQLDGTIVQSVKPLPPGAYKVSWTTGESLDESVGTEDLIHGEFGFTVAGASSQPAASGAGSGSGVNTWAIVGGIAGLVVVGLGIVVVARRRSRTGAPSAGA